MIPENNTSGFVFLLVFASPTGRWEDRIAAVRSDEIPVFARATRETSDSLLSLPVHEREEKPGPVRRDAMLIRLVLAFGWVTCGCFFWRTRESARPWSGGRILIPVLAALAAIWEMSPLEQILGDQGRAFAAAHEWYEMRQGPQKILTVTFALGVAATLLILIRRRGGFLGQVPLIGLALHVGVTLVGFLSLHRVDAILSRSYFSVPLIQILQLGALSIALTGAVFGWRQFAPAPRPKD